MNSYTSYSLAGQIVHLVLVFTATVNRFKNTHTQMNVLVTAKTIIIISKSSNNCSTFHKKCSIVIILDEKKASILLKSCGLNVCDTKPRFTRSAQEHKLTHCNGDKTMSSKTSLLVSIFHLLQTFLPRIPESVGEFQHPSDTSVGWQGNEMMTHINIS